jgi:hypothetical protein
MRTRTSRRRLLREEKRVDAGGRSGADEKPDGSARVCSVIAGWEAAEELTAVVRRMGNAAQDTA